MMYVVYNKDHTHHLINGSKMLMFAYNSDRGMYLWFLSMFLALFFGLWGFYCLFHCKKIMLPHFWLSCISFVLYNDCISICSTINIAHLEVIFFFFDDIEVNFYAYKRVVRNYESIVNISIKVTITAFLGGQLSQTRRLACSNSTQKNGIWWRIAVYGSGDRILATKQFPG
jgi:hypothetical protein